MLMEINQFCFNFNSLILVDEENVLNTELFNSILLYVVYFYCTIHWSVLLVIIYR